MPAVCHCKHCWGDCDGTCLFPGDQGLCIHKPYQKLTLRDVRVAGFRRMWRRVFWGVR
jgi:hypothetical protein